MALVKVIMIHIHDYKGRILSLNSSLGVYSAADPLIADRSMVRKIEIENTCTCHVFMYYIYIFYFYSSLILTKTMIKNLKTSKSKLKV